MIIPTSPPPICSPLAGRIVDACERHWDNHKAACNYFVQAVAKDLRIVLTGTADDVVKHVDHHWLAVRSGFEAAQWSYTGYLIIAGLLSRDHTPPRNNGHVAIVVPGPLANGKYPTGYWGSLGSQGHKATTLNYAWTHADRDNVIYRAMRVSAP